MPNEKKLRRRMFGYKTKDVHEYITTLSENAENLEKKYKSQVEALNADIKKLTEESKQQSKQISELEAEKNKLELDKKGLGETILSLERDNADSLARIASFENERRTISEVLISARNQANEIISEAKSKADEQLSRTKAECDEQRHLASIDLHNAKREIERTADTVRLMKKDLLSAMESYGRELDSIISEKVGK